MSMVVASKQSTNFEVWVCASGSENNTCQEILNAEFTVRNFCSIYILNEYVCVYVCMYVCIDV